MSTTNKILLALLGGTVIGTAIGIIFAPEKGEETRRKITDAAKDLSDRFSGTEEELTQRSNGHRNTRSRGY